MSVVEKILEDAKQGFVTALRDGKIDSGNLVKVVAGIVKRVNALPIEVEDKKEFLTMALKKAAEAAGVSDSAAFAVLDKAVSAGHDLIDAVKVSSVATLLSLLVSFLSRCVPACSQVAAVTSALDPKDTELIAAALKAEKAVETVESTLESLTVKVSETGERLVEVLAPLKEVQEDTPVPNVSDMESSPEASPLEVPVLKIRSEALD
jgi:hypothetical protein